MMNLFKKAKMGAVTGAVYTHQLYWNVISQLPRSIRKNRYTLAGYGPLVVAGMTIGLGYGLFSSSFSANPQETSQEDKEKQEAAALLDALSQAAYCEAERAAFEASKRRSAALHDQMLYDDVIETFIEECKRHKEKVMQGKFSPAMQQDLIRKIDNQLLESRRLYDLSFETKRAIEKATTDSEKKILVDDYVMAVRHYETFTKDNLMQVAPLRKLGITLLLMAGTLLGIVVGAVIGAYPGAVIGALGGAGMGLAMTMGASYCLFGKADTNACLDGIRSPAKRGFFSAVNQSAAHVENASHQTAGVKVGLKRSIPQPPSFPQLK